jgi:hypothetical protein
MIYASSGADFSGIFSALMPERDCLVLFIQF